jgi:hypothetical protein
MGRTQRVIFRHIQIKLDRIIIKRGHSGRFQLHVDLHPSASDCADRAVDTISIHMDLDQFAPCPRGNCGDIRKGQPFLDVIRNRRNGHVVHRLETQSRVTSVAPCIARSRAPLLPDRMSLTQTTH